MRGSQSVKRRLLGVYLFAGALILFGLLLKFWPTPQGTQPETWLTEETIWKWTIEMDKELRFLFLVLVAAALGSYVHAATSFATYVGNRNFVESWTWWYVLRPLIGIALGLVFYLAIRGGLLIVSGDTDIGMGGLCAMMGVAGLVGLFSKEASDKLSQVAKSIFGTPPGEGDDARKDKLGGHLPVQNVMIPRDDIVKVDLTANKSEKDVTVAELHKLLTRTVTRIPVLDVNGAAKYVIHESVLFRFLADTYMVSGDGKDRPDPAAMKLETLLSGEGVRDRVTKSMAFVAADAKLTEAQEAMMKKAGCRDVFVTQSGKEDEPVLGWLTNVEIEKFCRIR